MMDLSSLLALVLGSTFSAGGSSSQMAAPTTNPRASLIAALHGMLGLPAPDQQQAAARQAQQLGRSQALAWQQAQNMISPHATFGG